MLPGNTLGASICARCQLRLILNRRTCSWKLQQRPRNTYFSTFSRLRDDRYRPSSWSDEPDEVRRPPRSHLRLRDKFGTKSVLKVHRGKFRESSEPLATQSLGSPSEILLLKDAGLKKSSDSFGQVGNGATAKDDRRAFEDTIRSIQQGERPAQQSEVNDILNGLRPRKVSDEDAAYITRESYEYLYKTLVEGFTQQQLADYMNTIIPKTARQGKNLFHIRSEWVAGTSPLDIRLKKPTNTSLIKSVKKKKKNKMRNKEEDVPLRSFEEENSLDGVSGEAAVPEETMKERQARRILKEYWEAEIVEEIESIGELEIYLANVWHINMLQTATGVEKLKTITSQRHSNVDIVAKDRRIRISADKTTAMYTADDIENILRSIKTGSLSLVLFVGGAKSLKAKTEFPKETGFKVLHDADLEYAETLTKTLMTFESSEMVQIHAFEEDNIEHAKRTLRSMLGYPRTGQSVLLGDASTLSKAIIHVSAAQHALAYGDRARRQGRWVLPVSRGSVPTSDLIPDYAPHKDPGSRDALLKLIRSARLPLLRRVQEQDDAKIGVWYAQVHQEAFADFGHVLHPITDSVNQASMMRELEASKLANRVFSYTPPMVSRVLSNLTSRSQTKLYSDNHLVLHLVPDPSKHKMKVNDESKNLPRIEMHWDVRTKTNPQFRGMRAFIDQDIADYLLPGHAVDVRFTRREFCKSNPSILENRDVELFDHVVRKSLLSGALLNTPPSLKLQLPTWFATSKQAQEKDYRKKMASDSTFLVTYVPAGFEQRQRLSLDISFHPLSFTTTIGGALSGSQGRLSLSLGPVSSTLAEDDKQYRDFSGRSEEVSRLQWAPKNPVFVNAPEDFIESAFNLAELIDRTAGKDLSKPDIALGTVSRNPAWAAPKEAARARNRWEPLISQKTSDSLDDDTIGGEPEAGFTNDGLSVFDESATRPDKDALSEFDGSETGHDKYTYPDRDDSVTGLNRDAVPDLDESETRLDDDSLSIFDQSETGLARDTSTGFHESELDLDESEAGLGSDGSLVLDESKTGTDKDDPSVLDEYTKNQSQWTHLDWSQTGLDKDGRPPLEETDSGFDEDAISVLGEPDTSEVHSGVPDPVVTEQSAPGRLEDTSMGNEPKPSEDNYNMLSSLKVAEKPEVRDLLETAKMQQEASQTSYDLQTQEPRVMDENEVSMVDEGSDESGPASLKQDDFTFESDENPSESDDPMALDIRNASEDTDGAANVPMEDDGDDRKAAKSHG